jgi:hypothetical protein
MEPSEPVRHFLASLDRLDEGQLLLLAAAVDPAQETRIRAARKTAERVAGRTGRTDELEWLRGRLGAWAASNGARAGNWAIPAAPMDLRLADPRLRAVGALFDAATARLLRDDLDPATHEALCWRWERLWPSGGGRRS